MNGRRQAAAGAAPARSLSARLGRWRRALGTGACFVWYGAAGWLGGLIVLPLVLLWPGSAARKEKRVRRLVSGSFRTLLAVLAGLGVGRVEVHGRRWLEQTEGMLVVANHPMYLDVVALVGLLPLADCVVKQAMWRNRFYRRFVKVVGYIGNADSAGLLHECVARLRAGRTVILFPEGTRSTPGQPLHFERGAAQVAVRSGCEVLPVVIRCRPLALGKSQAWHDAPGRAWVLEIHVCRPRSLAELGASPAMPHGVAARRVNAALQALYAQQLGTTDAIPEDDTANATLPARGAT